MAYDLQFLLTRHRYYLYRRSRQSASGSSPEAVHSKDVAEISLAELCCHTLLISDDSRHRSYCLLLLSHVDIDKDGLRERASKYGLKTKSTPCSAISRRTERSTTDSRSGTSSWS